MREGQQKNVREERSEEIMEHRDDARISAAQLEKTYFDKFKEILSCKKIYRVQRAEMRFHRDLLKGMRGKGAPKKKK